MKYYIISAAINLGILLIPIATPVLKQKLEEKKEKQTIVVDLKNSILEENKIKSTVDTDSNEESNGTAGLQKGNPQNKNNAISKAQNIEPNKQPKNPKQSELSQAQPIQPKQPQQPAPQPPKVPQNTPPKEQPKPTSRPIIPPVASTPKTTSTQPVILQSTGNPASSKLVQNTITASNSTISNNSGHKNTPSNSETSHGNKNGNTANGSSTGSKNGNGTGTNGNSTSSGNGNDKKSGSTRGEGCRRGVDFSVSYNSHLEVPTANQRLKRKETIVATIRFTRGGSVSIQSVTGGNSQSQAAARRAASNVHVSFLTNNCSSGIVTLQFNIN